MTIQIDRRDYFTYSEARRLAARERAAALRGFWRDVKRVAGGVVLLSKTDPWASIAEAYALTDPKHPIRRHKGLEQKRTFKWP